MLLKKPYKNITAHVSNSLQRTQHHHYIEQSFESELSSTTEYLIADEILSTFISKKTDETTTL